MCRFAAFFLCPLLSFAQEHRATLRVEVIASSKPVPDATVVVNGATLRTGRDGVVTTAADMGEVKITASKAEYMPASTIVKIDHPGDWVVSLELHPEETVEDQITVYATRTDRRLQDSPLRVEVLDRDEIEEKMMMTPGDIVMMLNEMGGLRVQTTSPSLGAASVRIQGMLGRYTRFLSDGLPLFGQQGAGLGLLQIPPVDLGQVEVIKGASSALYGAGAMAGVVNLISRRPTDEPVHEVLINRSTLGATDASLFLGSRLSPHWGATVLASGDFQQRNDRDGDGWADLAGYNRGLIHPRFYWDSGDGRTVLITGGVTVEDRQGGAMADAILPRGIGNYSEALHTQRYDLGVNAQFTLAGHYVLSTRGSYSSQNHRHQFGEVTERDRHEMAFAETSLRGAAGRHTWVAGVAFERDAYRPHDVPRFAYSYRTPSVFLQDDFDVTPWFSLSGSARADSHNLYGTFFSPRLSALFRHGGWTSRISAAQGFFAPTPLTEETESAGLTRLSVPAPLRAERGRTASFDLTRSAGPVSITSTFFTSSIRNPVYVERDTRYAILNLPGSSRNLGAEFLGTWRKAPFSATASYTFVSSRQVESGTPVQVPLTPRHSFGLVGMWEKEKLGRLGVECYYTGRQRLEENPYRDWSKPYVVFGIMGERKFGKHYRLFLNLENLTNVRQTRWDPLLRQTRAVDGRWTVDAWAPLDGRVINGGMRFLW